MELQKISPANGSSEEQVVEDFYSFIKDQSFPCVAAKAALKKQQISCYVAGHMACPHEDSDILNFLYGFVDSFRSVGGLFNTACVIFRQPSCLTEQVFDSLLWIRLQALADMDAKRYEKDKRVSSNPSSADFSFSLKEEAFYVVGLNPASERPARRFKYPTLVFNAHAQFEQLRSMGTYEKMKKIIRKNEMEHTGSINPMLEDFGLMSEVRQYSGKQHPENWKCPLNLKP